MAKKLIERSAQEIIAGFPARIALEGAPFGMEGIIVVKPGEVGYFRPSYVQAGDSLADVDARHERVFGCRAPSDAEREAAAIGSLCGWGVPGADPLNHEREDA